MSKKVNVVVKNIDDDFSDEIKNNKKIIILVDHSLSSAKEEVFVRYIKSRYYWKMDDYVVAIAKKDRIPTNRMKPGYVINLLENDMKEVYNNFKEKNEGIKIEGEFAFHYVADISDNGNGELMSVALMRTRNGFNKVEFSPIIKITETQYNAIVLGGVSEEEQLIHSIVSEDIMGDELYGLVGYITNGKVTTLDMYMQNLLDIIPIYNSVAKRRKDVIKYRRYNKKNNKSYLNSISKNLSIPGEHDLIV